MIPCRALDFDVVGVLAVESACDLVAVEVVLRHGEFFSRALNSPLSGTTDWVTQETPFFLKAGQDPSQVKLNLVVDGKGSVWIDNVVLARAGP